MNFFDFMLLWTGGGSNIKKPLLRFKMKKILYSIALIAVSANCFGQTTVGRETEGICYQSAMEKAKRTGIDSLDKNLLKWVSTNFDVANRVSALSKPGGKCAGADNDCFKRNLSQPDFDFGMGMLKAMALFARPQDPSRLPNLEVGLATCAFIKR
jgi:hypothetical protein